MIEVGVNVKQFILTLPKAELHIHLEVSLEPEMLLSLAERNRISPRWRSVDMLCVTCEFTNLEDFLALYFKGCRSTLFLTRSKEYQLGPPSPWSVEGSVLEI